MKKIGSDLFRPVRNSLGQLALEALSKRNHNFAGNDRQYIDIVDIVAQHISIHTLAVLIDTQTEATAYLLTLANIAAALFQGTNLEYIGLSQPSRSAEWEKMKRTGERFGLRSQQFLIFHNQVVSINIVGSLFLLVGELTVGHLALLSTEKYPAWVSFASIALR